jgi:hypothetical protein
MKLKRVAALAMAALMTFAQPITAMANSTDPSSTTGATGNILAYSVERIVVPTDIQVAFNPNEYPVTARYEKTADQTVNADKTYYVKGINAATFAAVETATNTAIKTYYEAKTSAAQIVSLKYGIANRSSDAKNIKVSLKASYDPSTRSTVNGKSSGQIHFVDTKYDAMSPAQNASGTAIRGAMNIYLAVNSAASTPTAITYKEAKVTTGSEFTAAAAASSDGQVYTKTGYTTNANRHSVVSAAYAVATSGDAIDATHAYVVTNVIGPEVRGIELADVNFTDATTDAGIIAFGSASRTATNASVEASVAYKLPTATWALKEGESIDYSTTQDQMDGKLSMSEIGGVTGFTIVGYMNKNADWTTAEATAIQITPTYEVDDIDETETYIAGTQLQIVAGPSITMSSTGLITVSGLTHDINFVSGEELFITPSGGDPANVNNDPQGSWDVSNWSAENGGTALRQVGTAWMNSIRGQTVTVTAKFNNGTQKSITVSVPE